MVAWQWTHSHRLIFIAIMVMTIGLTGLAVMPYDGNVSALLHMDRTFGTAYEVPPNVVLYTDGGYDGMAYYQIAREIPALFSGEETAFPSAYRFQRILFPMLAQFLALGSDEHLPWTLLLINLLAAAGTLYATMQMTKRADEHTALSVLNPAMLVGILFSLTEPISLLFMALFFWRLQRTRERIDAPGAALLFLSLLGRETTIFLIVLLILWYVWKRDIRSIALALVPLILFFGWQTFLVYRFGDVAFQANGTIMNLSLRGPRTLLLWLTQMPTAYRLSSVPLLLFLAAIAALLFREAVQRRSIDMRWLLLMGLVGTTLSMDPHMWGVITSIGRVVTPLYPAYILFAADRNSSALRMLSFFFIVFSIIGAIGIALQVHPYVLS